MEGIELNQVGDVKNISISSFLHLSATNPIVEESESEMMDHGLTELMESKLPIWNRAEKMATRPRFYDRKDPYVVDSVQNERTNPDMTTSCKDCYDVENTLQSSYDSFVEHEATMLDSYCEKLPIEKTENINIWNRLYQIAVRMPSFYDEHPSEPNPI
jgi:hypothetical protein